MSLGDTATVDLTNCDREPIHIPGSIQSHGFLLGLKLQPDGRLHVVTASENAAQYLSLPLDRILDAELNNLVEHDLVEALHKGLLSEGSAGDFVRFIGTARLPVSGSQRHDFQIVGHRLAELFILEFERTEHSVSQAELNAVLSNFVGSIEELDDRTALCQAVTSQIRALTGFDRIMLYQFDEEGHGTVLAEDRNDKLPSYLGLHFPATDIPQQARALYVLNRIRIIPDVDYEPSPLLSVPEMKDAPPLDLSLSILRSVSPIHREYMRNMGTVSSMSISLVTEGRLWGLISGHHHEPRTVPYLVRSASEVLSRITTSHLLALHRSSQMAHAIRLKSVHGQLLSFMAAGENYIDGLARHPVELLAVTGAQGAAIVVGERCILLGKTPSQQAVLAFAQWFSKRGREDVFATNQIELECGEVEELRTEASGILAISLSQVHRMQILWFRPEILQTVQWAGEPAKSEEFVNGVRQIHPRNSFSSWKEIVRGKSLAWTSVEIESAREFRSIVLEIVLKRAEELAEMASELESSNRELEAFSYSVSHDLRAPFRHISGFAELLLENEASRLSDTGRRHLATIAQSAQFAGLLVDSLLNFSRISRTQLEIHSMAMKPLVEDVWRDVVQQEIGERQVEMVIGDLPVVEADLNLLRQVWRNLISNAVKYTRPCDHARIEVSCEQTPDEYVFAVRDNGVGFEGEYAHKLFGAFQRLHRMEEFEGTGIGLANVRRIIARHNGRTWATGEVGKGAVISFSLPAVQSISRRGSVPDSEGTEAPQTPKLDA
ncbi:ATP-binding protein [Silvibacterium acidisoli]|uniref:ATP-binding protein n=1 Tax=Acidobacteriaceae bacterium ZG23-2 TaxID=2883246 RepID=UPI00406D0AAE